MGTGDERERPGVVQPTSDTPISVFDGGGDDTRETPPASVTDNQPITTRAYIIRVDYLKATVPTHPTFDTPICVYDSGGGYVSEALMETGDERERPGVVQPTSDTNTGVFDGGGDYTRETQPSSAADNRPITTRAYIVHLNDMGNINHRLKDKRDKLNVDKLKLCSAATQSEDSVATE